MPPPIPFPPFPTIKLLAIPNPSLCPPSPPPQQIPDHGLPCDLLWSDPSAHISGWSPNDRGVSYTFGSDVVAKFLAKHDLDLICRSHQVVEDGYEFFDKRKLLTLFSAPNYCDMFDNSAAMMKVDEGLVCSFVMLKAARAAGVTAQGIEDL